MNILYSIVKLDKTKRERSKKDLNNCHVKCKLSKKKTIAD